MDGTVHVQPYDQNVADLSCRLQIPHVPNMQQIKTSVRRHNLLPGQPQLFAAIGKVIKLDDFWAHSFSLILRLCVNCCWSLTNLRNGFPRMTKRKTKHNAGKSRSRHGITKYKKPIVHLADDGPDVHDRIGLT